MSKRIRPIIGAVLSIGIATTMATAPTASASVEHLGLPHIEIPHFEIPNIPIPNVDSSGSVIPGAPGGPLGPGAYNPSVNDRVNIENQIRDRINNYRASQGLPRVKWNGHFDDSSRWWSDQVANHGKVGHSPGNTRPYRFGGENVWYGNGVAWNDAPARAVDAWINSPGHRSNLLARGVSWAGVGAVWSVQDVRWVVTYQFETP